MISWQLVPGADGLHAARDAAARPRTLLSGRAGDTPLPGVSRAQGSSRTPRSEPGEGLSRVRACLSRVRAVSPAARRMGDDGVEADMFDAVGGRGVRSDAVFVVTLIRGS